MKPINFALLVVFVVAVNSVPNIVSNDKVEDEKLEKFKITAKNNGDLKPFDMELKTMIND